MKHSGQSYEALYQRMERDNFLSPEEAKQLGLIDQILEHPPEMSASDGGRE